MANWPDNGHHDRDLARRISRGSLLAAANTSAFRVVSRHLAGRLSHNDSAVSPRNGVPSANPRGPVVGVVVLVFVQSAAT
jgi:hypothetical protein